MINNAAKPKEFLSKMHDNQKKPEKELNKNKISLLLFNYIKNNHIYTPKDPEINKKLTLIPTFQTPLKTRGPLSITTVESKYIASNDGSPSATRPRLLAQWSETKGMDSSSDSNANN